MTRFLRLWRAASSYVRHDLREIIAPSSLPDPPNYVPPPKTPLLDYVKNTRKAFRTYLDTWDSQKLRATLEARHGVDPFDKETEATRPELKSLLDEFGGFAGRLPLHAGQPFPVGAAARGGATALKPFLQNLWNTRAVAYRDAVQQFITGYKEGFQEANKHDIPPDLAQEAQAAQKAAEGEGPTQAMPVQEPAAGPTAQQLTDPPKQPKQPPLQAMK